MGPWSCAGPCLILFKTELYYLRNLSNYFLSKHPARKSSTNKACGTGKVKCTHSLSPRGLNPWPHALRLSATTTELLCNWVRTVLFRSAKNLQFIFHHRYHTSFEDHLSARESERECLTKSEREWESGEWERVRVKGKPFSTLPIMTRKHLCYRESKLFLLGIKLKNSLIPWFGLAMAPSMRQERLPSRVTASLRASYDSIDLLHSYLVIIVMLLAVNKIITVFILLNYRATP